MQASRKRLENEYIAEEAAAQNDIRGGARRVGESQERAMNWPGPADEDIEG